MEPQPVSFGDGDGDGRSEHYLTQIEQVLSTGALASIRCLIVVPDTSSSTLLSVLETLTSALQLTRDSLLLHHILKLLAELASEHPALSHLVRDALHSNSLHLFQSPRLAADYLSALVSVSASVDDTRFTSLCLNSPVSSRMWLLRNAQRLGVKESVMLAMYMGFTRDPYPYVRKLALEGLVRLCINGGFEDHYVIEGCCCRAVDLISDQESVRSVAARGVVEWGKMLVESSNEGDKADLSDALFILVQEKESDLLFISNVSCLEFLYKLSLIVDCILKLCGMVKDMCVDVKLAAFDGLGKIKLVSQDVLLQTLTKRVQLTTNMKKSPRHWLQVSASDAAGAFLLGLEDEFLEVRSSAYQCLRTLSVLSAKFASEALKLLMDFLNNRSEVRSGQVLDTILHIAAVCGHIDLNQLHMHNFRGMISDNNALVRSAAWELLKLARRFNQESFDICIKHLLENLEAYPQDEGGILSALFFVGRKHGKFASRLLMDVYQELEPDSGGKLSFDCARTVAYLVLAISIPLSGENEVHIPSTVFSFAVTQLGRISHALHDVMSQDMLLSYLSFCSINPVFSLRDFPLKESLSSLVKSGTSNNSCLVMGSATEMTSSEVRRLLTRHEECNARENNEVRAFVSFIFTKVQQMWLLLQSGHTNEVLKSSRVCKEEVETYTADSPESAGILAFALQYLKVMKLFALVISYFSSVDELRPFGVGNLEFLLSNLDKRLRGIRSLFHGLSNKEELHILELLSLTFVLRLFKVDICCYDATFEKLSRTIARIEVILEEGFLEPSSFLTEVKNVVLDLSSPAKDFSKQDLFKKLFSSFSPGQIMLGENIRYLDADLEVPGNDSYNPLAFVSGLPVSVPIEITVHNLSSELRLWLRIVNGDSTEFMFLDPSISGFEGQAKKLRFSGLSYCTPCTVSFILKVSLGIECLFEEVHPLKNCGGPKHDLTYICAEKDVYLYQKN